MSRRKNLRTSGLAIVAISVAMPIITTATKLQNPIFASTLQFLVADVFSRLEFAVAASVTVERLDCAGDGCSMCLLAAGGCDIMAS